MHRPLLNDQKLSDQKALRGYSAYQLRRSSQGAVRMLLHSIMRRELWAHHGPVMGKGAAYWRTARLRGLHIYQRSFASSPNFLPVAPIYESRRLPKWNETMKQVRRFNIALGDNLTGCFGGSPADPAECQRRTAQRNFVNRQHPQLRPATTDDAVTIAALSVQVFLDTYAPEGIRPDLALEAFSNYSTEAFVERLAEPSRCFFLSEHETGLVGFAELLLSTLAAPVENVVGAELVRLYVQPQAHGMGIGRHLLQACELAASNRGLPFIWLTAWEGNHRACDFYKAVGYTDIGATTYTFQGNTYGNRVFAKQLTPVANAA